MQPDSCSNPAFEQLCWIVEEEIRLVAEASASYRSSVHVVMESRPHVFYQWTNRQQVLCEVTVWLENSQDQVKPVVTEMEVSAYTSTDQGLLKRKSSTFYYCGTESRLQIAKQLATALDLAESWSNDEVLKDPDNNLDSLLCTLDRFYIRATEPAVRLYQN